MDDRNPYLALLGIDLALNTDVVINLNKRRMKFEKKLLRVIVPMDPTEGVWYTKLVGDYVEDDNLDQIYKITLGDEYWINPTTYGWIMSDRDNSCTSDSDEELEH